MRLCPLFGQTDTPSPLLLCLGLNSYLTQLTRDTSCLSHCLFRKEEGNQHVAWHTDDSVPRTWCRLLPISSLPLSDDSLEPPLKLTDGTSTPGFDSLLVVNHPHRPRVGEDCLLRRSSSYVAPPGRMSQRSPAVSHWQALSVDEHVYRHE